MEISIVPMSKILIDSIASVEQQCFSTPWSKRSLEEELSNPNAIFFAAVSGETVLGYIGCIIVCKECSITNIAVLPSFRRQGVASLLLNTLITAAKDRSADLIFLEVRTSNSAAQSLYQKFGFCVCGERKAFYRNPTEDALIMNLSLN